MMNRIPLLLLLFATAPVSADDPPTVDRFGDPLPSGAALRLGFVRTSSSSPLNLAEGPLAAFSPDGQLFATASYNRIHVWEVKTGRVKRRFQLGDEHTQRLVFTNEGKSLLVQGRGNLHSWDIATGRETRLDGKDMRYWYTTFLSPRGRWLVDGRGEIWDLVAGKKVPMDSPLPVEKAQVSGAFTADERWLFLAAWKQVGRTDHCTLEQWDVAAGKRHRVFEGFQGRDIACSPDGRTIAATLRIDDPEVINKFTHTIVLFDTEKGRELRRLPASAAHFESPVFSADGKRFAAVRGREVLHVWDTATGKELAAWHYRRDHLHWLAFSPDGQSIGACGDDGTALVWDMTRLDPRLLSEEIPYRVTDVLFSRDGKQLVAGYSDGSIRFWDLATQEVSRKFRYGESAAYSAITSLRWAGSSLLFRSHMKPPAEFHLLDWKMGVDKPLSLGKGVHIMAMTPEGRTVIIGPPPPTKHSLYNPLWQPLTPEQLQAARDKSKSYPELKGFRLLSPALTKEKRPPDIGFLGGGESGVPAVPVAVSPDGKYTVESVSTMAGSPYTGMGVYWTPSGQRVVEASTRRVLYPLPAMTPAPVFLPDGRGFLSWPLPQWGFPDKKTDLQLLESRTGKERWRVTLDRGIGGVTVSPCGRWLAVTEHEADSLHVLDAASGKRVHGHKPGRLYHGMDPLAFSPDSKLLARSMGDGTILLWRVPEAPPAKEVDLTADEIAALRRDLSSEDAAVAFTAILRLAAAPKVSLPLLRKELLLEDDKTRIEKLVADLGSEVFATRQRATLALEALGEHARPYLSKALRPDTTLETRRRLERLLAGLADPFSTPVGLRQLRAIETLERIGSEEARRILEEMGDGEDALGREAQRTVERMRERRAASSSKGS